MRVGGGKNNKYENMGNILDTIINGAASSAGSGLVGIGLGAIKGDIQEEMQDNAQEKIAQRNNEIARQNALDKWSIEKASMEKAGINMAALNGMQTMNIPAMTPTPQIENTTYVPPIAQQAQSLAQTEKTLTENEKEEEFLKQSGEYWKAVREEKIANANRASASALYDEIRGKNLQQETDIRKAVVDAYGDKSAYGRQMRDMWLARYDSIDAETKKKMSEVGLNEANMILALQKTVESEQFVQVAWANALIDRAYKEGIVAVENGKLQWEKEKGSKELQLEEKKWRTKYKMDLRKINLDEMNAEVQREYQRQLIKTEQQNRYWKPVSVCSQAFRDIGIGFSGFAKGLTSFKKLK